MIFPGHWLARGSPAPWLHHWLPSHSISVLTADKPCSTRYCSLCMRMYKGASLTPRSHDMVLVLKRSASWVDWRTFFKFWPLPAPFRHFLAPGSPFLASHPPYATKGGGSTCSPWPFFRYFSPKIGKKRPQQHIHNPISEEKVGKLFWSFRRAPLVEIFYTILVI